MIVTRTPLRISFVGGGSDLPSFWREEPGFVVSAAIDKYIHVTVSRKFDAAIRVAYSETENVRGVQEVRHDLVRAALLQHGPYAHVEIHSIADVPAGTGLGSSSSFTVGLLHALHAHAGLYANAETLAQQATEIELGACGRACGLQDQYAAAYGGLAAYTFDPSGTVRREPLGLQREVVQALNDALLVFSTGLPTRDAGAILSEQSRMDEGTRERTRWLVNTAQEFAESLRQGNIKWCGAVMDVAWTTKRQLATGVSSPQIDGWYTQALRAGAWGGKLCGAGGGGFLAFLAPPDAHAGITRALGLRRVPAKIGVPGSEVVYASV